MMVLEFRGFNFPTKMKVQIKLVTTCNKTEQQEGTKSNAELYTKWTMTTWKNLEDSIRRGRNKIYIYIYIYI